MKKSTKVLTAVICLTVGVLMLVLIQDRCYVKLLDAINAHDNQQVEKLLKYPHLDLNKGSGHIPYRWFADFDENNTPLEMACKCGNYEAAKLLIDKGADASLVREGHFSPLYLIMEYTDEDDLKLVKLLVENGADPNGAPDGNNDGECSLIKCAGMDCSDYDFNGFTQKDTGQHYDKDRAFAAGYDKSKARMIVQIYKYLEKRVAMDDFPLDHGVTPLQIAAGSQNLELIEYLIRNNTYKINAKDDWGGTPLFSLISYERIPYNRSWKKVTYELLLKYGADVLIKDKDGKTAYDYAVEYGDDYLAELLKPYMN